MSVNQSEGAAIRQQRVERGMSLREAADHIGITYVQLEAVELNLCRLEPEQRQGWDAYCRLRRPAPVPAHTLLDLDAEPVGGWWPDGVGEPVVRVEGRVHARVGTVVEHDEDAATLPLGTVVDYGCVITSLGEVMGRIAVHCLNAHGRRHWRMQWPWKNGVGGATILYVPMGESNG